MDNLNIVSFNESEKLYQLSSDNKAMEVAISQSVSSKENNKLVLKVLEEVFIRALVDGEWIIPCDLAYYHSDNRTIDCMITEDKLMAYYPKNIMMPDKSVWTCCFTSLKFYKNGGATDGMTRSISSILQITYKDKAKKGVILNEFSEKRYFLTKDMIKAILILLRETRPCIKEIDPNIGEARVLTTWTAQQAQQLFQGLQGIIK